VTAVPANAIAERDGQSVVWRVQGSTEGGTVEAVAVKPGRQLGDLREVQGPIKPGDKIVVTPPARLKDGARVALSTS